MAISPILRELIALAAGRGAAAIGLNPLHALFTDRPDEPSPYCAEQPALSQSALYRRRCDPGISRVSGGGLAGRDRGAARHRHDRLPARRHRQAARLASRARIVPQRRQRRAPRRLRIFSRGAGRGSVALCLLRGSAPAKCAAAVAEWPQPWRSPARAQLDDFRQANAEACEFHEFVQWIADRQLGACWRPRAGTACRSVSTPISRSASTATAPMPGASRTPCSPMSPWARRPTNSTRRGKTGAWRRSIRTRCRRMISRRCGSCWRLPCGTPALSGSITCSACNGCS